MSIRVVAGAARGRRLRVPRGERTRPTAAVVREALFDMLAHRDRVVGRVLLDLFAGSGALGIEALSRGAAEVVFVEDARSVARLLVSNVEATGVADRAEVLAMPMERALGRLERRGVVADGVLADPPYESGWAVRVLRALAATRVLAPGGWIALEHAAGEPPIAVPGLAVESSRRYGSTALTMLVREEAAT